MSTKRAAFERRVDVHHALIDLFDRARDRRDGDFGRVAQEVVGEFADLFGHGGRQQHRLPFARHLCQDLPDRRDESEVEHLVGLVEHDVRGAVELDDALRHVVEQPTGGGDDEVDPRRNGFDLRAGAHAADDDRDGGAGVLTVGANAVSDLLREFASRRENERATSFSIMRRRLIDHLLQQRQDERGGFAGAGLRGTKHIFLGQHGGNDAGLNGCGGGVALGRDGTKEVLGKAEVAKMSQLNAFTYPPRATHHCGASIDGSF